MTSTGTPAKSMQQLRREWIAELTDSLPAPHAPATQWRAFMALMLDEGPALASESNRWWVRRLRWIEVQAQAGELSTQAIVLQALRDMQLANEDALLRR